MRIPTSITLKGRAYDIRAAGLGDAATIAAHRQRVFIEHGRGRDENLSAMADAFAVWLRRKLREGRYVGWLAEHDGVIVAGVGVLLVERPPHPAHFGPLRGYVMNAYTERMHRASGIDGCLLRLATARAQTGAAAPQPSPTGSPWHESVAVAVAADGAWS